MPMILACLDFETFYSDDYTLSKMTTEAYVRDARFEALGCACLIPAMNIRGYIEHDGLPRLFDRMRNKDYAVLCHHAHFDGLIMSHHFDYRPQFWLDTLSMGRQVHGNALRLGLGSLAAYYKLAAKSVPYNLFKGKRFAELDDTTRSLLAEGAIHDAELTLEIFKRMRVQFPASELPVIDLTIRCFTEPKLIGDTALFDQVADDEWNRKNEMLQALGVSQKDLASADKFVALLEQAGVDVGYKAGANGPIPAIAKSDQFMRDLLDDPNAYVADLAEARVAAKSTLKETRAARLADMSTRGAMPVYLMYCGAHTTRWSGGDSVNLQNLPRIEKSPLRKGLRAPPGWRFAAPDQSQGECRILNWLAGQQDVLERFANGHDPYIPIASQFYGFEVTKAHPAERGTGKLMELSCGFGAGGPTIQATAAKGQYGPPVQLSDAEALRARDLYRAAHPQVVGLWNYARDVILPTLFNRGTLQWGPMEVHDGRIYLPSGGWINYETLEWDGAKREWLTRTRNGWRRIYGAKLVENVVQALSRCVTSDAMKAYHAMGFPVVGMAHDDVWLLVPDDNLGHIHARDIEAVMARTPNWAPGLPLGCECKLKDTYGG